MNLKIKACLMIWPVGILAVWGLGQFFRMTESLPDLFGLWLTTSLGFPKTIARVAELVVGAPLFALLIGGLGLIGWVGTLASKSIMRGEA
jgi:hypothetical protein